MPFLLIRNDITKVEADVIVNPANTHLKQGSGTSRAIYLAAGEEKLTAACQKIGHCDLGNSIITKAYSLPAKYVIHTVGPVWKGGTEGEDQYLYSAYVSALKLAKSHRAKSIAFPLLSSGNYGYPKERALKIAVSAISDFLLKQDMMVYMVLYDHKAMAASHRLFASIEEYIDDHYVDENDESFGGRRRPRFSCANEEREFIEHMPNDYYSDLNCRDSGGFGEAMPTMQSDYSDEAPILRMDEFDGRDLFSDEPLNVPKPAAKKSVFSGRKLEDIMKHMGETFSQMLLRLIDERGLTDSEVYHKANIDRRHFSKIRKNKNYVPNKKTVMAFAIALQLSLDETIDLLRTAGFAFSNSSKFDVIIRFFLENEIYDVFEINEMLFAYEQPLLGE